MAKRTDFNLEDFDSSLDFSQMQADLPDFEGRLSFISELERSIDRSSSHDELNQAVIDNSGMNLESLEGYQDSFGISQLDLLRTQKLTIPKLTPAEVRGTTSTQISPANLQASIKLERQEVNSGWSCTSCVGAAEEKCSLL